MPSQNYAAILAELVTLIEGITAAPLVFETPRHSDQITKLPAVDISWGGSMANYDVSQEYRFTDEVILRIYAANADSAYEIQEQIADAFTGSITLNGTCIGAWLESKDPPRVFAGNPQGGKVIADVTVRIQYRREYI